MTTDAEGASSSPAESRTGALFDLGLQIRGEVLGAEYVDRSIQTADDFMSALQAITTEWCWGYTWSRQGIDRRTRSMLNLAMLTALNRGPELRLHVRGALNNGVTVDEIRETLLHATVYCGIPAGLDAFKAAHAALLEEGALDAPEHGDRWTCAVRKGASPRSLVCDVQPGLSNRLSVWACEC